MKPADSTVYGDSTPASTDRFAIDRPMDGTFPNYHRETAPPDVEHSKQDIHEGTENANHE